MNNFREGLNTLKEISDPEKMKMALERITGKKLADYEGIDALVGALMGYYNGELERKLNTNGGNVSGSLTFTNTNPLFPMIVGRRYNNDLNNRIPTIQGGIVYSTVQDRASERNLFPATNNACGILSLNTHEGAYGHQLGFSDQGLFHRIKNSGNFSSWRKVINDKNPEYLGQIGVNSIEYIQDNIQKIEGKGYFDKVTGKLYKCIKNANSSITSVNAEYFISADNISISKAHKSGESKVIYTNPNIAGGPLSTHIDLSENISNFETLIFEVSHERNGESPQQFMFNVKTLIYDDTTTTSESQTSYLIATYSTLYGTVSFRSNKTQIYVWGDPGVNIRKIYGIY